MWRLLYISILVLILYPEARWASQHYHADETLQICSIQEGFQSPYVTALIPRSAITAGCVSSISTGPSSGREVHVIYLRTTREGEDVGDGEDINKVTLLIRPHSNTGIHTEATRFVLASDKPILWSVISQRLDNSSRHHFMLSQNSRVSKDLWSPRSKVMKYGDMPTDSLTHLVDWVSMDHNMVVVSAVEVRHTTEIVKKLGMETGQGGQCSVAPTNALPDTMAYNLHPTPFTGCVVPYNHHQGQK